MNAREVPHAALNLLMQASRVSPHLRAAMAEVESYINAQVTDYDDATDCPICAQLATDRDDALNEVTELSAKLGICEVELVNERAFGSPPPWPITDAIDNRDLLDVLAWDDDVPVFRRNQCRQAVAEFDHALARDDAL